jgi:hypothetical protein
MAPGLRGVGRRRTLADFQDCRQHARESALKVVEAKREESVLAVQPGMRDPGFSQHPEMMRERRWGYAADTMQVTARSLRGQGQRMDDLQPHRIAQGVEHGDKRYVGQIRMIRLPGPTPGRHAPVTGWRSRHARSASACGNKALVTNSVST